MSEKEKVQYSCEMTCYDTQRVGDSWQLIHKLHTFALVLGVAILLCMRFVDSRQVHRRERKILHSWSKPQTNQSG